MTHIAGLERDQLLLLPEAVDDYVGSDNPVRFIDAFVDGLDLTAAGFLRVEAKAMGRPGYAPGDLLKLYIYGYLNRVRSSRRLETECHRNIEVLWLLRTLKPDFKTIADFRRQSRGVSRRVPQFVLLCRRLDLYGRELLAVEGTRIKAVNNKDRNFTRSSLREIIRRADDWLEDYLKRLDEGDVEDGPTGGGARTKNLAERIAALNEKRGRYQAMLAQLDRTGGDQISLTDPDSRAMAAHTKVGVGYNVQVAVDATNKLIVEQAVTNQVVDMGLLMETSEPAREILGVETIDVVADRGYFKIEDIEACEQAGCVPHVAKPQRGSSVREGLLQGRVPIRRRARARAPSASFASAASLFDPLGAAIGRTVGVRHAVSLVRRAYDRREGVRRLDLLQEPRPPAHPRDCTRVSGFASRPAGGEAAFERRAFFGRWNAVESLGVDEELPSEERLGRRPGDRPGRAAAGAQPRDRLPQDQAIEGDATTDKDARLYRKGAGQESRLAYLGHTLMENRNGLVAAAEATLASGTGECEAAAAFSQRLPKGATLGADKGYDAEAFVEGLKARGIAPHIAINGTVSKNGVARKTAVPSEVAPSAGYAISQRLRKRIEEGFGELCGKLGDGVRKAA